MSQTTKRRPPRVLAIGGGGLNDSGELLDRHLVTMTERDSPRVCLVPSSGPEGPKQMKRFYDLFGGIAEPSHLTLGTVAHSPDLVRRHLLAQDAIYAGGGGMLDVLQRLRAHGVDDVLRDAWRGGIVMAGQSAGSLCWFEAGITAVGGQPRPVRGLGLLPASNSVHWSAAPRRRRTYIDCVADGMPAGWGIDDGAASGLRGDRALRGRRLAAGRSRLAGRARRRRGLRDAGDGETARRRACGEPAAEQRPHRPGQPGDRRAALSAVPPAPWRVRRAARSARRLAGAAAAAAASPASGRRRPRSPHAGS